MLVNSQAVEGVPIYYDKFDNKLPKVVAEEYMKSPLRFSDAFSKISESSIYSGFSKVSHVFAKIF